MSDTCDAIASDILNRLAVLNYALLSAIDDLALREDEAALRRIKRTLANHQDEILLAYRSDRNG
jgi:hypothetical protein